MIKYKFMGQVSNEQVLEYYNKNRIDCFVHASELEGAPVSIMEAESAGIPIISTDVGGVKEMIDGNGFLLPINFTPVEMADKIVELLELPKEEREKLGKKSRQIWEEKLDAEKNAKEFVSFLGKEGGKKLKNIILITNGYPYLGSEIGFLQAELKELLKSFDVTIIACITTEIDDSKKRIFEANALKLLNSESLKGKVTFCEYTYKYSFLALIPCALSYFFDKRVKLERKEIVHSKNKMSIKLWESIKYYGEALAFYNWYSETFKTEFDKEDTIIYSFWNLPPVLGLCLNRNKIGISKILTRVHGYDYQDEQWGKRMRKPFAPVIDTLIDKMVFVCNTGKEYYCKRHSIDDSKCIVSFLGSGSYTPVENATRENEDIVASQSDDCHRIVSCASLIPLKRVNLIIEALGIVAEKHKGKDLEWIHFGDGVLREEIEQQATKVLGN
ncbi:glycosyl transferase GT4 family [Butyrivibrio proteoclasticus B316]|uniref:Glycosyl transferase GT4 family n=1 Tax=Butyrivibrio proteoclasticus (strain ATCC 51982 / DSM 14932 / B316) TaxID=515622 RepID=E0RZF9_BUTPB|nr:glycosyltransferase [Butyrivibrio proteoclasticus]ADL33156.1 glycosyl transferase GT4 family [Butyrivibrio proteoclasticus B316]